MSNELILGFPVLKGDGGDFLESVFYNVDAVQWQNERKLTITHTLKGESFIAELIKNKKAKFSVSLFYKDNAERQSFVCGEWVYDKDAQEISATQDIIIDFNYAPEIMPFIFVMSDEKITVDEKSGLTDFWRNEKIYITAFSRIAHHSKLGFISGDVSSLMWKDIDESYKNGTIKTIINETAGEGEQPIKIICAKDVYDELDNGMQGELSAKIAMRKSIITQILCCVYSYMNKLAYINSSEGKENNNIHSGLLKHLEMVKEKTSEDWENNDNFNASFAATQMIPYAIEALNKEDN